MEQIRINKGIDSVVDEYVTTFGPYRDTGEIDDVDGYDVYGTNDHYYQNEYLKKCPICGKDLKEPDPYNEQSRTDQANAIDLEKRRNNSELMKYADLAIEAATEFSVSSEEMEKEINRRLSSRSASGTIWEHLKQRIKTDLEREIAAIVKSANAAKEHKDQLGERDSDKKALDDAVSKIPWVRARIFEKRVEKLNNALNLEKYIAANQAAFQTPGVANRDLDDGLLLVEPYKCDCTQEEENKDADTPENGNDDKTSPTDNGGNASDSGGQTNGEGKTPTPGAMPKSRGLLSKGEISID